MDAEQAARYYRKRTGSGTSRRRLAREGRIIKSLLGPLSAGARVIDAPCGIGPHTAWLKQAGYQVVAVDLSPHMLGYAVRDAAPDLGLVGDARRLPLADDAADALIVIRLFHYLDEAERRVVLREAGRVARLVVVSFMHRVAVAPLWRRRPTRKTIDVPTLEADAAAVGMGVVRVRAVFPLLKRMWFAALERAPEL